MRLRKSLTRIVCVFTGLSLASASLARAQAPTRAFRCDQVWGERSDLLSPWMKQNREALEKSFGLSAKKMSRLISRVEKAEAKASNESRRSHRGLRVLDKAMRNHVFQWRDLLRLDFQAVNRRMIEQQAFLKELREVLPPVNSGELSALERPQAWLDQNPNVRKTLLSFVANAALTQANFLFTGSLSVTPSFLPRIALKPERKALESFLQRRSEIGHEAALREAATLNQGRARLQLATILSLALFDAIIISMMMPDLVDALAAETPDLPTGEEVLERSEEMSITWLEISFEDLLENKSEFSRALDTLLKNAPQDERIPRIRDVLREIDSSLEEACGNAQGIELNRKYLELCRSL